MSELKDSALALAREGWAVHPLRNNADGFAKVAIVDSWQTLMPDDAPSLGWDRAQGMGIIGGANSGNLGFIDIDDAGLAADAAAWLISRHANPLMAWTARSRIHVYCIEPKPSQTRKLRLIYKDKPVFVELRASGSYVAAPPTPHYKWLNPAWEPLYMSLSDAWNQIADALAVSWPGKAGPFSEARVAVAGYPTSWAARVSHGERNDACFYESSCLKDARVPMEQAWAIMQTRINQSYDPPLDWRDLRRTFESAYRRPPGGRVLSSGAGVVDWAAR